MKLNRTFTYLLTLSLCLAAMPMFGSTRSIRCGSHLVSAGGLSSPGYYEVLKKCGEPEAKMGNTWIYRQGGMDRILTFNSEGRLQRIESRRA